MGLEGRGLGEEPVRACGDAAICMRLLRQAKPFRLHIFGLLVIDCLAIPLALLAPLPLKIGVDSFVGDHPLPGPLRAVAPSAVDRSGAALLAFTGLLVLLLAAGMELQRLASSVLGKYTGENLELEFRARLFRHAQRISLIYHDSRGTTDSLYRIFSDGSSVQWIGVYGVAPFVTAVLTLLGMIVVTVTINTKLALVALAVVPLLLVLTRVYRLQLRDGWIEVKELETESLSVVQETLQALRQVKAYGREEHESGRFHHRSRARLRSHLRVLLIEGFLRLLVGLCMGAGTAAVIYVGLREVKSGALTLGELLLVMGYLTQLYGPLQTITHSLTALQASITSAARAYALLDHEPEVAERPDPMPLERAKGAVEFRNVTFGYDDDQTVLHDVSFTVEPGMCVGIAGATGAGKSTVVSLLARFYDPRSGEILLDGCDLRDYRLADLRDQFAFVFQEPLLFSTSVFENIAYARPEASYEEVQAAAEAANAHPFITRLTDGYDTSVGDRGLRLSVGERQRISLARAFLRDAPILVLDEPTSSVDIKTEALIVSAIERLVAGRTTFMIAHRLSTLETCDVLLEIEDGRVAGFSTDVRGALQRRLASFQDVA